MLYVHNQSVGVAWHMMNTPLEYYMLYVCTCITNYYYMPYVPVRRSQQSCRLMRSGLLLKWTLVDNAPRFRQ
jgi:hypothetical protein